MVKKIRQFVLDEWPYLAFFGVVLVIVIGGSFFVKRAAEPTPDIPGVARAGHVYTIDSARWPRAELLPPCGGFYRPVIRLENDKEVVLLAAKEGTVLQHGGRKSTWLVDPR